MLVSMFIEYIDGLVQYCGNSSVLEMELSQSYTKSSCLQICGVEKQCVKVSMYDLLN